MKEKIDFTNDLSEDDRRQLRSIHAGERIGVPTSDVERWRAAGWLEPYPSWKLTSAGLGAVLGQKQRVEFKPWEDPEIKRRLPVRLDVKAPPCPGCIYWDPVARTDAFGEFASVRLCHNDDMHFDFSCYKAR